MVANERMQAKVTCDRGRWEGRNSPRVHEKTRKLTLRDSVVGWRNTFMILKGVTGKRSARSDVINDTEGKALIIIIIIIFIYIAP